MIQEDDIRSSSKFNRLQDTNHSKFVNKLASKKVNNRASVIECQSVAEDDIKIMDRNTKSRSLIDQMHLKSLKSDEL